MTFEQGARTAWRTHPLGQTLITVRVTGWSNGDAAVDYTVNAALGLPYMTGGVENGSDPVNHVLPAWDLLAGAYAAFAALAAERHRRDTGQGREVVVPLSDVALTSLGHTRTRQCLRRSKQET